MLPVDLLATAVDAIGATIAAAVVEHHPGELILAGGGCRNVALVNAITRHSDKPTRPSSDLGVPIDAREALEFSILGALCADGVPITLPQVTGCRKPAPLSGVWSWPRCLPMVPGVHGTS